MSEMTLASYEQGALTTALPTAFSYDYCIPGILSEIGEVYGKFAKSHRDRWAVTQPAGSLQKELVKEFGDICWPTAVLLHIHDVHSVSDAAASLAHDIVEGSRVNNPMDAVRIILKQATLLDEAVSLVKNGGSVINSTRVPDHAQTLWELLRILCPVITGRTFDYVLGMNLAKLSSRKDRGVIEGSGDNR